MNPIASLLAILQAAIALALLFVVPGITLGPVLAPGASTPLARIGRAAGVSLLAAGAACTVVARFGLLRPTVVVAVLLGLTILPLHSRLPGLPRWPTRRARRWWLGAIAAVLVVAALVVLPSRLAVGPELLPFTSTVWYYANLARVVAATGGFPAELPEWGASRPFQTDYLPVTAHTAAGLQMLPGDLLVQLEIYRLAVLVVTVLLATLLFRRWVSSWLAVLGAVLLLATVRLDAKFLSYKPETWALALALFTLWLVDRALTERSRRLAITAAASAAVVFLAHAEVFLVLAAAIAGIAVARAIVIPGGGPESGGGLGHRYRRRLGLRRRYGWAAFRPLGFAVAILVAGIGAGVVANAALVGQFRLLGYVAERPGVERPPVLTRLAELPPGWRASGDATWDFYVAAVAPALIGQPPPSSFIDSRLLSRSIVHVWPGLDGRDRAQLVILGGLLGLPLIGWAFADARRQRAVVAWAVFGVALVVGSLIIFVIADTYVPQRVGPRRLVPYELLLPVGAAVFALWGLERLARPGIRAIVPGRRASAVTGIVLTLLTAAAIAPGPTAGPDDEAEPGITATGYDAYRWIAGNLPAEARILTNAYTDGSLGALAERVGVLDGRAVYLEDRTALAEATALLLGARRLFLEPTGAGAEAYAAREAVDYLLVVAPPGSGSDLGGYEPFATDVAALSGSDRYTLVRTFGDGRLLLFRLSGPS